MTRNNFHFLTSSPNTIQTMNNDDYIVTGNNNGKCLDLGHAMNTKLKTCFRHKESIPL